MGLCVSNENSDKDLIPANSNTNQAGSSSATKKSSKNNNDQLECKQVKLEDSNMANHGSKEHRELRKQAAGKEKAWVNLERKVGLQIWRIEKFQVVEWPKSQYGEFYDGDSYIILHTQKDADSGKFLFDVYFWLGADTSQDEAGTAAYKTVELDDYLDDEPVQYREVMGNESKSFLDLFAKITILNGGIESGFTHVEQEQYNTRLLHVSGYGNKVQVYQVPIEVGNINNHDSFILDTGEIIYQFNGNRASKDEKWRASQIVADMKSSSARTAKDVKCVVIDGMTDADMTDPNIQTFWAYFGSKTSAPQITESKMDESIEHELVLQKVSNASGHMQCTEVERGKTLTKANLDSDDCFIVDSGNSLYIWCGRTSNKSEKRSAMDYAIEYLKNQGRAASVPISRQLEGREKDEFWKVFAGNPTGGKKIMSAIWDKMFN